MGEEILLARAAKHFWEEPPISGTRGSGTVFFSGCSLGCVYCQNYEISHERKGKAVSEDELSAIFDRLISQGVHNINLVNPTHYTIKILNVLQKKKPSVPVVYNSSGYEKVKILKKFRGLVDVYLPDLKYITAERSLKYSDAENYFDFASKAIVEMKKQCPENIYDENGIMKKGLIVRHLILPRNTNQAILILEWIASRLGTDTAISLMSQYTPYGKVDGISELQRRLTVREYDKVIYSAEDMGFTEIFTQEKTSATEAFIPEFDFTGI